MWGSTNESVIGSMFDNNASPDTGKKQKPKKSQSVTPIVIGMINNCESEEFTMWGNQTSIIKLVCIVRKVTISSTSVTYELEDHTGKIDAIYWLESGSTTIDEIPVNKEKVYVKVFGNLRTNDNKKIVMILNIATIDKVNEITCHLLETAYVRFMSEKVSKGEAIAIRANNPGAELTNSMMALGGDIEMEEEGMSAIQRTVFRFMKTIKSEIGVSRTKILENFPTHQRREIEGAIDFLTSEGHIFSTIDHDHFQVTTV